MTSGGTEAIFDIVAAMVHPGDEVIVFEPCYDSYVPAIEFNGGQTVVVSLRYPDYAVPWDEVRAAITPRTRLIILNSPHNPDRRRVSAPRTWRELHAHGRRQRCAVVSDEVYEHIIFDGLAHESLSRYDALRARSFIVGSFGKTYHVTGWKVGYVAAPAALTAEFRKVHQFVTFSTSTPVQYALAEFPGGEARLSGAAGVLPAQARLVSRADSGIALETAAGARHLFPAAGLFGDHRAKTTWTFAVRLTREHGVAVDPDVGVSLQRGRAAGAAVLLRQTGRDAARQPPNGCGSSEAKPADAGHRGRCCAHCRAYHAA